MKHYRPNYFDKFTCIADKCDFTCCQDWIIAVDDETLDNWKNMDIPEDLMDTKSNSKLSDYVEVKDSSYIRLENHKCPFLNEKGLCNIVLKYGEENISDTCHTFPRERREYADRMESSLSLGCKAAVQLLFEKDNFDIIETEVEDDYEAEACPQYLYEARKWFMDIMSDRNIPANICLKVIFYLALDIDDKNIDDTRKLDEYKTSGIVGELLDMMNASEIRADFYDQFNEDNELLLDLFIRYYEQEKYLDNIADVFEYAEDLENLEQELENGFDEDSEDDECEKLFRKIDFDMEDMYNSFNDNIYNKYNDKIRLIIKEELFASLLTGEMNIQAVIVKIQWLAIELAVLKQWMFIRYCIDKDLDEDKLLQIIAVLFRITGYCDDDIFEYLDNSFEEIIWDWGYMNLII